MKRIYKVLFLIVFLFVLISCGDKTYNVSFDTDGGSPEVIKTQIIRNNELVREPIDSIKENYIFLYWANSSDLIKWEFNKTRVTSDVVLKAIYKLKNIDDDKDNKPNEDDDKDDELPIEIYYKLTIPTNVSSSITDDDILEGTLITLTLKLESNEELVEFLVNDSIVSLTNNKYSFNIKSDTVVSVVVREVNLLEDTYIEDFTNIGYMKEEGNFSEYLSFDYYGNNNITYDVLNGRIDLGLKDGENGITLGGFGNELTDYGLGFINALDLKGGISYLEFKARLPFSPNSTYPQGPGSDKASNVKISVYINDKLIETLKFSDDKKANTGQTFVLENLEIKGNFDFKIEVSSGHRLTIGSIKWITNKSGNDNGELEFLNIDFERTKFKYDTEDTLYKFNEHLFYLKEVHTDSMHPDKELAYMTDINGSIVSRFRGASTALFSTEKAHIYNKDSFLYVSSISFLAKQFGSNGYFAPNAIINVYVSENNEEFILIETFNEISETKYDLFTVDINLSNVIIKIEVEYGTLNIDNIVFKNKGVIN